MKSSLKYFFVIFTLCCCSNPTKKNSNAYLIVNNCSQYHKKVSIKEVLNSTGAFNNQPVEISGYYHMSIEESVLSIYPKGSRNTTENTLWIDFDRDLIMAKTDTSFFFNELLKIDRKKIEVKGMIEAREYAGGHPARIKDVCYIRVLK